MEVIINFIKDINVCYLILNLLLFIDLKYYLKTKKLSKVQIKIILLITLFLSIGIFFYGNGFFQSIFELKYLSVKFYLVVLIITNIITLYTFNRNIALGYATLNYTLFILMMIIFGSIVSIILGNKFENLYIMDISNAITLIDLSFVIFILYLILFSIMYIGYQIFLEHSIQEVKETTEERKNLLSMKIREVIQNRKQKNLVWKKEKKISSVLSEEELLNYPNKHNFYINGVDCSIIFEDSNTENIIKNYHILLNDVNAKLVNGYTLKENQLLRSICMKLKVTNLNFIDIDNTNLLNCISLEEYNFLRSIMENY